MNTQTKVDAKVVLLGETAVGKTSLVVRFLHDSFGSTAATIGASFAVKTINTPTGESYTLGIWDTAGQEKYDSLSTFYCRAASCALILFDITRMKSFENVQRWVEKLANSEPEEDCLIIIAASKLDLVEENQQNESPTVENVREVSREMAEKYAQSIGAVYIETSAKTNKNVKETFDIIVNHMMQKYPKNTGTTSSSGENADVGASNNTVNVHAEKDPNETKKNGGCC